MFGDVYSACSTSFHKHTQVCTVVYSFTRSARVKYLRDFKGRLYLITNQYGLEFFSVKKKSTSTFSATVNVSEMEYIEYMIPLGWGACFLF